jgi:hypothetical protein
MGDDDDAQQTSMAEPTQGSVYTTFSLYAKTPLYLSVPSLRSLSSHPPPSSFPCASPIYCTALHCYCTLDDRSTFISLSLFPPFNVGRHVRTWRICSCARG